MNPQSQPVTYTVVSQYPDMDLGPGGTPVRGVRVMFDLSNGDKGSIFVPNAIYSNLDQVQQMVQDAAVSLVNTANISGTITPGG